MMRFFLLTALLLGACSSLGTPPAQEIRVAPPPSQKQNNEGKKKNVIVAIPCVVLVELIYSMPRTTMLLPKWKNGTLSDPGNKFDTPATVARIRKVNALIDSVCNQEE